MVHLVLVFCLTDSPSQCQKERQSTEPLSLMSCMIGGQRLAERWLADHPKWMLSRSRCVEESRPENAA
jgi:hypothetical protein